MTRSVITFDNVSERPVTFTGRKNVLINGNFDFWERGTAGTYTSGIWQYLSADRWGCHFDQTPTGAALERSSQVPNSGSSYSIEVKGGTSGGNGNCYLSQRIESNDLRQIRKMNSFTVSGWVKNTGTAGRSIGVNIICPTATDDYSSYTTHGQPFNSCTITGDATTNNAGGFVLTSNDTWYYFTATCTNPNGLTNFDKGAQLYFNMGGVSATSEQVHYAQIQMEAGTQATEFEHRPQGEEYSLCRRFFQKYNIQGRQGFYYTAAWGYANFDFPFDVTMRVNPVGSWGFSAVTNAQPGGGGSANIAPNYLATKRDSCNMSLNNWPNYQMYSVNVVSGGAGLREVYFDAEL